MSDFVEFGIDLGTTNSCIARWQNGGARVFQNTDNMNVTPSAVYILKSGRTIIGRRAYSGLQNDPNNVAVEFKRWIGQSDKQRFPSIERELSSEELSAEILKSLREDVKRQTGEDVDAAVITVPAAFGSLQCDATARAAKLSGLIESPLLQEPIAAAIGYGVNAQEKNQRWMVFDLGGGTLDIAIVSTKEGRLHVLEHRGDNRLGGKDIDKKILDEVIIPTLQESYRLSVGSGSLRAGLYARLKAKVEEAKIDLSTRNDVALALYDVGADDDGKSIELEVPLSRSQLNACAETVFLRACDLANEALGGARIDRAEINKILLVGGPTQTPVLRQMLDDRFRAPLDFSMDPMTVVAQGAAVYASTLMRSVRAKRDAKAAGIAVKLAYEAVSARNPTVVQGRVQEGMEFSEIRIDAEGGFWTSGWIRPNPKGIFQVDVSLKEGDVTNFWVYARDQSGGAVAVDTPEFKIRHGLVPSSPPLPHTISVEIYNIENRAILESVFQKGTSLPASAKKKFRCKHSLVPNNPNTDVAIKLWEGEFSNDPEANEWIGNVLISNERVPRTIPEGAEIEIEFKADSSRSITVNAFIPILNETFTEKLYVASKAEQDYVVLAQDSGREAEQLARRIADIETTASSLSDLKLDKEIADIKQEIDKLRSGSAGGGKQRQLDPDEARRTVEASKRARGRVSALEQQLSVEGGLKLTELESQIELAKQVVEQFGTSLEKQQLKMLEKELERAFSRADQKGVRRMVDEIEGLRWRVLGRQDWFWKELFQSIVVSDADFSDRQSAQKLINIGREAVSSGDADELKRVVRELWKLQPRTMADAITNKTLKSGLKKF